MRIFYIPSEHRRKFLNVIELAPNIIYTPLEDSKYVRFHDATLNGLPTVHIKPALYNVSKSYGVITSNIIAELNIIPSEAVYAYFRELGDLPNE